MTCVSTQLSLFVNFGCLLLLVVAKKDNGINVVRDTKYFQRDGSLRPYSRLSRPDINVSAFGIRWLDSKSLGLWIVSIVRNSK
jgi:hypothetical protein